MKRISTLFSAAMLAVSATGFAQPALQEDFSSATGGALPSGWTVKSKNVTTGWFTESGAHTWYSSYAAPVGKGNYAIIDDFNNNQKNDSTALVSPVIDLTGKTGVWLTFNAVFFKAQYSDGSKKESAWVAASKDGGATWTAIKAINPTPEWSLNAIDMSAYGNMNNVKIAFFYSDDKEGQLIGCAVDDIKVYVPPTNEMALNTITPYKDNLFSYGVMGTTKPIGGEVFNNGTTPITTFKVHYQLGTNTVVTDVITGANIAPFTAGTFTAVTPLAIPGTKGTYPLKMWVELTGDATATNDTANANATSVISMPAKKIFVEEGTGTWCGWCPRGAVYMDSLAHTYPGNFTLVAVHNQDPMTVTAYDAFMGTQLSKFGTGYPSVYVDRREMLDPSQLIDVYTQEKDAFGFAEITMADQGATSFGLSVKVSVKPTTDLSGDYRLALVLTENDLQGLDNTTPWSQHNYYFAHASSRGTLVGAGHDWNNDGVADADPNQGGSIPGEQMFYQFVGRAIVPSPTGAPSSLPSTMTAGSTYDYTFTTTVPQPYHRNNMHIVAIMIRNSDGAVLNSAEMVMPLGISNVAAGVKQLSVYPNPATDKTTVAFTLNESAKVSVQVLNTLGQVVNSISEQQYAQGAQKISINTANMSAGIYTIKLSTEKGSLTQQLSVIK